MRGRFIAVAGALIVSALALPAAASATDPPGHKVPVCHVPPGNPGNAHTIIVDAHAVPAHLAHGDKLGFCHRPPKPPGHKGDGIKIVPEPPGEFCEFGGVKIIVYDKAKGPEDPDADVLYVCNGAPGEDGEDGEDGNTVDVFVELPGENCPAGGVKIVVTRQEEDQDGRTTQTFYVCNGVAGPIGPVGPVGPIGPAGPKGDNGLTPTLTVEPAGLNCAFGGVKVTLGSFVQFLCNGAPGQQGEPGQNAVPCRSLRRRVPLLLPNRYRNINRVALTIDRRTTIKRVRHSGFRVFPGLRGGRIMVNMRGKKCGSTYGILVRVPGGVASVLRLWRVESPLRIAKVSVTGQSFPGAQWNRPGFVPPQF